MIVLAFGKWSTSSGDWFVSERIYFRGKWTPFCRVRWRYPTRYEYWERVETVRKLLEVQAECTTDDYMHGLYNGLELALATMEDRDPVYADMESGKSEPLYYGIFDMFTEDSPGG